MNIDRELEAIARRLLKRPALRRGPFLISDDELRQHSNREHPVATGRDDRGDGRRGGNPLQRLGRRCRKC